MRRRLVYRPDALDDLNEAKSYTIQAWGRDQARRYVSALVTDIKALRVSALRFPLYDDIHPGLRRKRSGMHHIYFLVSEDTVDIVNIIHVQRDPGLHLKLERWSDDK